MPTTLDDHLSPDAMGAPEAAAGGAEGAEGVGGGTVDGAADTLRDEGANLC